MIMWFDVGLSYVWHTFGEPNGSVMRFEWLIVTRLLVLFTVLILVNVVLVVVMSFLFRHRTCVVILKVSMWWTQHLLRLAVEIV